MILSCIPLMSNDKYRFVCLLAICTFLFEVSIQMSSRFLIGLFAFLMGFQSCLYLLDITPMPDIYIAGILFQFVAFTFLFLLVPIKE